RAREAIELRFAIVIGDSPLAGDRAFLLELDERGVERAVIDQHAVAADLLDAARDTVPVLRTHCLESLEHHQGERTLPNVGLFVHAYREYGTGSYGLAIGKRGGTARQARIELRCKCDPTSHTAGAGIGAGAAGSLGRRRKSTTAPSASPAEAPIPAI